MDTISETALSAMMKGSFPDSILVDLLVGSQNKIFVQNAQNAFDLIRKDMMQSVNNNNNSNDNIDDFLQFYDSEKKLSKERIVADLLITFF